MEKANAACDEVCVCVRESPSAFHNEAESFRLPLPAMQLVLHC